MGRRSLLCLSASPQPWPCSACLWKSQETKGLHKRPGLSDYQHVTRSLALNSQGPDSHRSVGSAAFRGPLSPQMLKAHGVSTSPLACPKGIWESPRTPPSAGQLLLTLLPTPTPREGGDPKQLLPYSSVSDYSNNFRRVVIFLTEKPDC